MKKAIRRSVSVVLSLLMIVSMFSVGVISTNAASDNSEVLGANRTYNGTEVMYFNMAGHTGSWWNNSGCYHYAYFFNGSQNANVRLCAINNPSSSASNNGSYYFAQVPAGTWSNVILLREKSDAFGFDDMKHNQSGDIPLSTSGNCMLTFGGEGSTSATWGSYALAPSTVAGTVTNAISGAGTSSNPYIVAAGESFTIEASATFPFTDSGMGIRYGFVQGTSISSASITNQSNTSTFSASTTPEVTTAYTVGARGYRGGTYSSTTRSATIYVKTAAPALSAPTGLTFTPADNIVTGDGTSSATPLKYYSGKAPKLIASASLPEGLTESDTTYIEYAIGSPNTFPASAVYSKDPLLLINARSGDGTEATTIRTLYARTNADGKTSDAVGIALHTRLVKVTSAISTVTAQDDQTSSIGVSLGGIYPYTGYGSAVITVKDGETAIAEQTLTQEEITALATNGSLSTALTFPKITSAGDHSLTASVTYEGVTAVSDVYILPDPTSRTMEAVALTEGNAGTTGGTVTVSSGRVQPGTDVTFTAAANTDYLFKGWYSDEALTTLVSADASYTFTAGEENVKLYASFLKELYLRCEQIDNFTAVPMQWNAQNKYYYYTLDAIGGTQYTYKITKTPSTWDNYNWNATPNAGGIECTVGIKGTGDFQVTAAENGKLTIIFLTDNTGQYLLEPMTYVVPFAKSNSIYVHAVVGNDTDKDGWSKVETINGGQYFFLPSTASATEIELLNTFGTDITVNGTVIAPGEVATVSYTAGTALTVTGASGITSITVMRSNAEGALYINSTEYDDLIGYLSQSKENSAKGTAAVASGSTVVNEKVKKIKGRGNTTWEKPKKPFNVTFSGAVTVDGLTDTKFSLLANYQDATLMRNRILYDLSNEVGMPFAPDSRFVDFYVNGVYQGSYQMSQKIELGEDHVVNLPDNSVDAETGQGVTSDFNFILELDNLDGQVADPSDVVISNAINRAILKGPDLSEDAAISAGQLSFMQQKYAALENALYNGTLEQLAAIVDIDSLAEAYLINELGRNIDGGLRSTYFTYNAAEGIFYAAPVWDFDCALGNLTSTVRNGLQAADKTGWFTKFTTVNNGSYTNALGQAFHVAGTVNGKTYQDIVANAWAKKFMPAVNNIILNAGEATGTNGRLESIVSYDNELSASAQMNYMKWTVPAYGNGFTWIPDARPAGYAETYDGMTAYMRDWLKERSEWMTDQLATFEYSAPAAVTMTFDKETYYTDDSLVITAAASGSLYWLSTETQADGVSFDTLAGATYTYEFYDGDTLLHTTTGVAGANVSYTIPANTLEAGSVHAFYVRAYATPSDGAQGTTTDSETVSKTIQAAVVWDYTDTTLDIFKDGVAVSKTTQGNVHTTNSVYANNGAYAIAASGVTATVHGTPATVSYVYMVTPADGTESTVADPANLMPTAGSFTYTVIAVASSGTNEYRQAISDSYVVNVQANQLSDLALTGTLDGIPVDTAADGIYDLKNFPAEDTAVGNFSFAASASVTQPVPDPQAIAYSYTLKENNGAAAAITDGDADDSALTFNIQEKCTAGNTYELTAYAQYESAGIMQTSTKTYKFTVKNTGNMVTVFFGAPAVSWGIDDIKLYTKDGDAYTSEVVDGVTDASGWITKISSSGDEVAIHGTGTTATSIATAVANNGAYSGTLVIYKATLPAEQWFTIGNRGTGYEAPAKDRPNYFQAEEGKFYYVYGEPNVTSACVSTKITDFKISAIEGTAITQTDHASAAVNETVTLKNVLTSRYASYQVPVRVDYYIGDQKIATSGNASSTTVTADVMLTNTPEDPSDFDFVVGRTYSVNAVVTEGNYQITYPSVVTITVTPPQASITSMTKSQVYSGEYLDVKVVGRNLTSGGYRVIENDGNISGLNRFLSDTENDLRISNLQLGQSKIVNVYDGNDAVILTRVYSRGGSKMTTGTTTVETNVAQINNILWLDDRFPPSYVGKAGTVPYCRIQNGSNASQNTGWKPMTRTTLSSDTGYVWYFDFTTYLADNPASPLQGVSNLQVQFSTNSSGTNPYSATSYSSTKQNLRYGNNLAYVDGDPGTVNRDVTIMGMQEVPVEIEVTTGAGLASTAYDIQRGETVTIYGIDRANSDNDGTTAHKDYTLTYVKDGGEPVTVTDFTYDTDDNNKLVLSWTAGTDISADGEYVFTITGKNSDGTEATDDMNIYVGERSTAAPSELKYIGDITSPHMQSMQLIARAIGGTEKLHFDFYMQYLDEDGNITLESLVGQADTTNSFQAGVAVRAPQQTEAVKYYNIRVVAYSIDPETPDDGAIGTKSNPLEVLQQITVTKADTNKIYFDPSWYGLNANDNPYINTDVTVTLTTNTGRKVTMSLDPDDENAERKYVFVGHVTDEELKGQMTFGGNTNGSSQVITTETAPEHAGYVYTMSTIGHVWGSYDTGTAGTGSIDFETDYKNYYPEGTDFTDPSYINTADQTKAKYLFYDNSVTKWKEVWLYTWGDFNTGEINGNQKIVQLKKLENDDGKDIRYIELPEGSLYSWANDNQPEANPNADTQGFMFVDRSGAKFGYQYMQSIDIKNWTGGIKDSQGNIIATSEFHFAEDFVDKHVIYPFFQAKEYTRINQADSTAEDSYRYRAYIQMMTDYFYNTGKTKDITFYVDTHTTDNSTITINRMSTDSGLYSYVLNSIEAYRAVAGSTIYTVTFTVPYTVDTTTLEREIIAKYAVTINGVTYGATLDGSGNIETGGVVPAAVALDTGEVWIDLPSRVTNLKVAENRADIIAYRHSTTRYNVSSGGSLADFSANIHYSDTLNVRTGMGNYSDGYYTLQYAYPDENIENPLNITVQSTAAQTDEQKKAYQFEGWYNVQTLVQEPFDSEGNERYQYVYTPVGTDPIVFTAWFKVKTGADEYTSYFILTKDMLNSKTDPWTVDGLRWQAFNAAGVEDTEVIGNGKPVDIEPITMVNGISYDIDGYIFKVTYHSNIANIRFYQDGVDLATETKRVTAMRNVADGIRHNKVYYINDYANYYTSIGVAESIHGWYNLKYTATFEYPVETKRFYQTGETLTHTQLNASDTVVKPLEVYVSADLTKIFPRVDSRVNEYFWPTPTADQLKFRQSNTTTIIPQKVETRQYSLTLVNAPEEANGAEVSAGTLNSTPEIVNLSVQPIETAEGTSVTYKKYEDENKTSTKVQYLYGITVEAPKASKDANNEDCTFFGWYDVNSKQFVSYKEKYTTIITQNTTLMPVYSDNTTLNTLKPGASIDQVVYETYVENKVDKVKIVFSTRLINPMGKFDAKLYVQRALMDSGQAPADSDWSAPVNITGSLNKDNRGNVLIKANIYDDAGAVNTTDYYLRAYVEYTDEDGVVQKVYSNIEVGTPANIPGLVIPSV